MRVIGPREACGPGPRAPARAANQRPVRPAQRPPATCSTPMHRSRQRTAAACAVCAVSLGHTCAALLSAPLWAACAERSWANPSPEASAALTDTRAAPMSAEPSLGDQLGQCATRMRLGRMSRSVCLLLRVSARVKSDDRGRGPLSLGRAGGHRGAQDWRRIDRGRGPLCQSEDERSSGWSSFCDRRSVDAEDAVQNAGLDGDARTRPI